MRLRIQQVIVPLAYDDAVILKRAGKKIGAAPGTLSDPLIVRRSLDARPRNPEPVYVLTLEVTCSEPEPPPGARPPAVEILDGLQQEGAPSSLEWKATGPRPIVVGAGPAGLLAAFQLAMAGAKPLLIERGDESAARTSRVAAFWNQGLLDPESNVLYGEGGAGLFSDGKLTARSKERGRIRHFMQILHQCGAGDTVLTDAEPHVGSDLLLDIVPRLRERIIAAGGEVRFRTRLDGLLREEGKLRGLVINGARQDCTCCVLATGHSARDTYSMLAQAGVALQPKPFAMGIRLEIPQADINRAQYGRFAGHACLDAASFRLTRRAEPGHRSCYSFCMCPGGTVISCASESGYLTTNGMSYSKRSLPLGNAAFLVPIEPADYPDDAVPALAGLAFQRKLEQAAFTAAGSDYALPACRLADFLRRTTPRDLPEKRSCQRARPVELRAILPEGITRTLEQCLPPMLKELNGVRLESATLYAPETRSSSPVWIARNPDGESSNTAGLFPAGEGAGYAGGIVSSAIDGMRAVDHILART